METATKAFLADSFATLLINASLSVQKLGHREVEKNESAGSRAHCTSLTWWMGTLLLAVGTLIHLVVLPYADLTLLAANGAVAILANLLLSIWLFNERFIWKYDLTAMLLLIGGTLAIVFVANKKQATYEGQELLDLIGDTKAVVFFIVVALMILLTHCGVYAFKRALRAFESDADLHDHKTRQEQGEDAPGLVFGDSDDDDNKKASEEASEVDSKSDSMHRRRPLRIVIATLNKLPAEKVMQVSERSSAL